MISFHILRPLRGVVLSIVLPLCVPPSILTHSLQVTPLVNRRQLTLPRCAITLYLVVAPICTYPRSVSVTVIEGGSHH